MLLIEDDNVKQLIDAVSLKTFYLRLCDYLTEDFSAWQHFQKSSRHACIAPQGIIELMPICGELLYSFKYVNGHPLNPHVGKLTVAAVGMLTDVATGYPLLICAMTVLTAIRTAAISALAARHLAKKDSSILTIIGCGAQSEFQVLAYAALFDLTEVRYFDLDSAAMLRFAKNLGNVSFELVAGNDVKNLIQGSDMIITATAAPGHQQVIESAWLQPGQFIAGIGGDSPGKTELDPEILKRSKVVVEYLPQTLHEGEIQNLEPDAAQYVYAEIWEIIAGHKPGRINDQEITLFDAVGFALEDYSTLRLVYELAQEYHLGSDVHLFPEHLEDCKDLYGLLLPK